MTTTRDEPAKVIGPLPWEDQFRAPTLDQLRDHYSGQALDFFDRLLAEFRGREGLVESFGWMGLPWRWSFSYRDDAEAGRPWGVVVPDPEAPRVSVPLALDVFEAIPSRTLTRYLREGIASAVQVGEVRWPEWAVTTPSNLTDVLNLVKHKSKHTLEAGPKTRK